MVVMSSYARSYKELRQVGMSGGKGPCPKEYSPLPYKVHLGGSLRQMLGEEENRKESPAADVGLSGPIELMEHSFRSRVGPKDRVPQL
jgi:hypothetical protein